MMKFNPRPKPYDRVKEPAVVSPRLARSLTENSTAPHSNAHALRAFISASPNTSRSALARTSVHLTDPLSFTLCLNSSSPANIQLKSSPLQATPLPLKLNSNPQAQTQPDQTGATTTTTGTESQSPIQVQTSAHMQPLAQEMFRAPEMPALQQQHLGFSNSQQISPITGNNTYYAAVAQASAAFNSSNCFPLGLDAKVLRTDAMPSLDLATRMLLNKSDTVDLKLKTVEQDASSLAGSISGAWNAQTSLGQGQPGIGLGLGLTQNVHSLIPDMKPLPMSIAASPTTTLAQYANTLSARTATVPSAQLDANGNVGDLSTTNIYIKGLPNDANDKFLYELCIRYGGIVSTKAIQDGDGGCKGYGFVDFETEGSAQYALRDLADHGYQVQMAKRQEQDQTNLYFQNLPLVWSEKELADLCGKYGRVLSTRILRHSPAHGSAHALSSPGANSSESPSSQNQNPAQPSVLRDKEGKELGPSKGIGFARLDSNQSCARLIDQCNGMRLEGAHDTLVVKLADCNKNRKLPPSVAAQQVQNQAKGAVLTQSNQLLQSLHNLGLTGLLGLTRNNALGNMPLGLSNLNALGTMEPGLVAQLAQQLTTGNAGSTNEQLAAAYQNLLRGNPHMNINSLTNNPALQLQQLQSLQGLQQQSFLGLGGGAVPNLVRAPVPTAPINANLGMGVGIVPVNSLGLTLPSGQLGGQLGQLSPYPLPVQPQVNTAPVLGSPANALGLQGLSSNGVTAAPFLPYQFGQQMASASTGSPSAPKASMLAAAPAQSSEAVNLGLGLGVGQMQNLTGMLSLPANFLMPATQQQANVNSSAALLHSLPLEEALGQGALLGLYSGALPNMATIGNANGANTNVAYTANDMRFNALAFAGDKLV